jgi:exopolysaccharide biosynthesis polyprenyl glycosylphosphotransferase
MSINQPADPDRPDRAEPASAEPARPELRLINSAGKVSRRPPVQSFRGSSWARRYRSNLRITDVSIIIIAVLASALAPFGRSEGVAHTLRSGEFWIDAALMIAVWSALLGGYHTRDPRVVGVGVAEYKGVVHATALVFGVFAIGFAVMGTGIPRGHFMVALPVGVIGLVLSRWLWRKWLTRQRTFGHYLSHAIVVGDRRDVEYVIGQIDQNSGAAYLIVGAVLEPDDRDPVRAGYREVPVVCDIDHVPQAASALAVDTVIVAGQPRERGQFIRDLSWALEGTAADLVLANRLANVAGPRIHFRPVEGLPLMHVELPQYAGGKHILKRVFDFVASASGLILLLPLLLTLALLIRLDSPGPMLFRQERIGRGGNSFGMLKFRSMVVGAEDQLAGLLDQNEGAGVLFKMKNDPRVTRFGRVMRKYSLDELPQLWNVLIGQMSLVGPRPPLAREVAKYEEHVNRRLYIKPGLTGMWQVNGRSNLDWDDSVRLDLYYVENWSLTGDLVILWRTLRVLREHSGAY